jgi:hypothetical protein
MDKKRKEIDITKENNKDFVKDGMTSEDIKKTIRVIREYLEKDSKVSIEDRLKKIELDNKFFIERYPMLYELSIRNTFNYEHLNYFLNMRDKVINDKISSEEASKVVGSEWFSKYVDVSKMKSDKSKI